MNAPCACSKPRDQYFHRHGYIKMWPPLLQTRTYAYINSKEAGIKQLTSTFPIARQAACDWQNTK